MAPMEFDQSTDVDIAHPVAVGQHKNIVVADVALDSADSAAGHGIDAGIGQGDLPTRFIVVVVVLNALVGSQRDGQVIGEGFVIEKELLDDMCLVAQAQDEIRVTGAGVVLHDVPQNGSAADGQHGLGNVGRDAPDPGSLSAAEDNGFHGLFGSFPAVASSVSVTVGRSAAGGVAAVALRVRARLGHAVVLQPFDGGTAHGQDRFFGAAADVRGDQHVGQGDQIAVLGRFVGEYVERGAG